MRLLYCAIDQTVPGTTGGSVHVTAVAEGLAALGHEVHVLVTPGSGAFPAGPPVNPVRWIPMAPPLGAKQLRWMRTSAVRRLVETLRPDVVMERYYNFGGEGVLSADAAHARTILEVNAPVIDHDGFDQGTFGSRPGVRAHAPLARAHLRPRRPHRDAERGHPAARHPGAKSRARRVGRRHRSIPSWRRRHVSVFAASGNRRDLCRGVQKLARRNQPRARDTAAARPRPHGHRRGTRRRRAGTECRQDRSR